MRILITNNTLNRRRGSELYVRDVALGLLKRGHTPIAYSTVLGEVAREIRAATIPVIDNLDALSMPPDVIHGQHHLDTMTALLRFPGVPAVSFCHGWLPWEETPPRFPRILRYVAVDHLCRDRLLLEHAIPEERVRLLLNFVDLARFNPRGPLPVRPRRALIFSNYVDEFRTSPVREACARHGIKLDVIGLEAGNACARPEDVLGGYDLVFAKGRCALEALAVGAAVIVYGVTRLGPMVTTSELDSLRHLNFGLRVLSEPINADEISRQIARYDADDAAEVSRLIRARAGCDDAVDQIISLYREVIAENMSKEKLNGPEESEAASAYLHWLAPTYKAAQENSMQLAQTETQLKAAQENSARLAETIQSGLSRLAETELQLKAAQESSSQLAETVQSGLSKLAERESQLEKITNSFGWRLISKYGPIKHRFLLPAYRNIGQVLKTESRKESKLK